MKTVTMREEVGRLIAKTWALACVTRRQVEEPWIKNWPEDIMTRDERRHLMKMRRHLCAAVDEVCALQASLAARSRGAGVNDPDYEGLRDAKY